MGQGQGNDCHAEKKYECKPDCFSCKHNKYRYMSDVISGEFSKTQQLVSVCPEMRFFVQNQGLRKK